MTAIAIDPKEYKGLYQDKGVRRSHRLKNKKVDYEVPDEDQIYKESLKKTSKPSNISRVIS